jgi:cell shape-determining protein MreD
MLVALFGAPMTALVSGFVCGFLFDLVGPYPFGSFLIAYLFAIEIVLWLSYTRFTNRSLLSLLTLISIGTLCFEIVCIVLTTVLHLLQPNTIALHMNQAWIVWSSWNIARNICITAVSYFIVRSFGTSYAILSQRSMSG